MQDLDGTVCCGRHVVEHTEQIGGGLQADRIVGAERGGPGDEPVDLAAPITSAVSRDGSIVAMATWTRSASSPNRERAATMSAMVVGHTSGHAV